MSNKEGKGAPKGGRVHWFNLYLSDYVIQNFLMSNDYSEHRYFLMRKAEYYSLKTLNKTDFFSIVRTSEYCFRVQCTNVSTGKSYAQNFKKSELAAEYIDKMSKLFSRQTAKCECENNINGFSKITRILIKK